jgi:hypothetical protein
MMMDSLRHCLAQAAECENKAARCEDAKARKMLLFVADRWRALAASDMRETDAKFETLCLDAN